MVLLLQHQSGVESDFGISRRNGRRLRETARCSEMHLASGTAEVHQSDMAGTVLSLLSRSRAFPGLECPSTGQLSLCLSSARGPGKDSLFFRIRNGRYGSGPRARARPGSGVPMAARLEFGPPALPVLPAHRGRSVTRL